MSEFSSELSYQRYLQAALLVRRAGQTLGPDFWESRDLRSNLTEHTVEGFDGHRLALAFGVMKDQIHRNDLSKASYEVGVIHSIVVPPEDGLSYTDVQKAQTIGLLQAYDSEIPMDEVQGALAEAGNGIRVGRVLEYIVDDRLCHYSAQVCVGVGNIVLPVAQVAERKALCGEPLKGIMPEEVDPSREPYVDDLKVDIAPADEALDRLESLTHTLQERPTLDLLTLTDLDRLYYILHRLNFLPD